MDKLPKAVEDILPELYAVLEGGPQRCLAPEPRELCPGVYVGTLSHTESKATLQRMRITHLLNCEGVAGATRSRQERYMKNFKLEGYLELETENTSGFDIRQSFVAAFRFVDSVRMRDGRVLVFGAEAEPRGAVSMGYLIHQGVCVLEAARRLRQAAPAPFTNRALARRVALYAYDRGLLTETRAFHQHGAKLAGLICVKRRLREYGGIRLF